MCDITAQTGANHGTLITYTRSSAKNKQAVGGNVTASMVVIRCYILLKTTPCHSGLLVYLKKKKKM